MLNPCLGLSENAPEHVSSPLMGCPQRDAPFLERSDASLAVRWPPGRQRRCRRGPDAHRLAPLDRDGDRLDQRLAMPRREAQFHPGHDPPAGMAAPSLSGSPSRTSRPTKNELAGSCGPSAVPFAPLRSVCGLQTNEQPRTGANTLARPSVSGIFARVRCYSWFSNQSGRTVRVGFPMGFRGACGPTCAPHNAPPPAVSPMETLRMPS
jgi:hypothetical protein